jgi:hypothetical protein
MLKKDDVQGRALKSIDFQAEPGNQDEILYLSPESV